MTQEVSLWLVPQPDDYAYLQELIDELATQYQAPRFSPHVTIAGRLQVPEQFQDALAQLTSATPVFNLSNQGLDHSSELFRTVYIRTSMDAQLVALRQSVYALWSQNIAKPFIPHISLIYKTLASPERREIIQALSIKNRFRFDALALVRPQQVGDWAAVETWQMMEQWPLADGLSVDLKVLRSSYTGHIRDIFWIRQQVFHIEQNIDPALDMDGEDETAEHFIAYWQQQPVGIARLRSYGDDTQAKIERVAVLPEFRQRGIGVAIAKTVLTYAQQQGFAKAILYAQAQSVTFYEQFGFQRQGEPFSQAGIPHIAMVKELSETTSRY